MSGDDGPVVRIAQGELRGRYFTTDGGVEVKSFQGIPYARPPLGKLRFQAPEPPEPWHGIRDATRDGSDCAQINQEFGSEDCLFLNIYTPRLSDALLPVMVWVHGGTFITGSGSYDNYGPDYLVEQDVMVVTINYRLGPLGFLSLETQKAPGNVGLKDQVAALRWVRDNISAFGGDPHNVTVFGESAGGTSVHYLMVTDSTKGLFQKAISQSGSALYSWTLKKNPRQRALATCAELGHPTTDLDDALEYLQTVTVTDLVSVQEKLLTPEDKRSDLYSVFGPTIENLYPGQEPIITETVLQRISDGNFHRVPYITGYNSAEGVLFLINKNDQFYSELEGDFERIIPPFVEVEPNTNKSVQIALKIKHFYFGDNPITAKSMADYAKVMGDIRYVYTMYRTTVIQTNLSSSPTWVYRFSYDGFSQMKEMYGFDLPGVCHGDDIPYLFKVKNVPLPVGNDKPAIKTTRNRFLKMWTDFAKTGNPTPQTDDLIPVKWEPVIKDKFIYLEIGEELSLKQNPEAERMAFWDELLQSLKTQSRDTL